MVTRDSLAAVGIETSDLPEGWMTVVRRKKRKKTVPTLPNVPRLIVGDMAKQPRYQGPEDELEWKIDIYWRAHNLTVDDIWTYIDMLEKLPLIPYYPIFSEMVPQDAPDDDEGWTHEIYRCHHNLTSWFKSTMDSGKSLNQCKEMGLPDLAGLPDLPDLPDHVGDLEECFKNLLTDTPCGNDETLVSGGIPNLGIEMNRNDIPELDLANVPGAVPPCGVGAKRKEVKKITKKVKKQLKEEADRHDTVAKQKKEKAEALRQSINYCDRKPEALHFAIDMNKKQPIEKEQCYTEHTEEKEKKKEQNTSTSLFVAAMMGVIMVDIEKGNEKVKCNAEAEEIIGMLQIQVLFN